MSENPILWQPSDERVESTAMHRFMQKHGFDSYDDLYQWSIDASPSFWQSLCEFCDVHFSRPADVILARPDNIMDAGWFAGSELNFAAHLLRESGQRAAIIFRGEDGSRRERSFDQLRNEVAGVAAGVEPERAARRRGRGHGLGRPQAGRRR